MIKLGESHPVVSRDTVVDLVAELGLLLVHLGLVPVEPRVGVTPQEEILTWRGAALWGTVAHSLT